MTRLVGFLAGVDRVYVCRRALTAAALTITRWLTALMCPEDKRLGIVRNFSGVANASRRKCFGPGGEFGQVEPVRLRTAFRKSPPGPEKFAPLAFATP